MSQFFTSLERDELEQMIRRAVHKEITRIYAKEEPEELIKAHEACKYLMISMVTLYKWIREDKIRAYHLGTRLYFRRSELIESLEATDIRKNEKVSKISKPKHLG